MFDINKNSKVNIELFMGSKIYTIDDFYLYPSHICTLLLKYKPPLHKKTNDSNFNGVYFEDRGHLLGVDEMQSIYTYLGNLCNQVPTSPKKIGLYTNVTRFKECSFNDYENNYWWPHYDSGYTALIYLNYDDEENGTNLYEPLDDYPSNMPEEHMEPWISKKRFKILKTLKPKYNRMILFDANKFLHGMHISNKKYFKNEYRLNQVLFFEKNTQSLNT